MNIRDSKKNKKSDAEQFSEYVCPKLSICPSGMD